MTDTINIPKVAFTIREFSEVYSTPVRSLYRMWAEGIGPARTKIGERKVLITRQAGDQWLDDNAESLTA